MLHINNKDIHWKFCFYLVAPGYSFILNMIKKLVLKLLHKLWGKVHIILQSIMTIITINDDCYFHLAQMNMTVESPIH